MAISVTVEGQCWDDIQYQLRGAVPAAEAPASAAPAVREPLANYPMTELVAAIESGLGGVDVKVVLVPAEDEAEVKRLLREWAVNRGKAKAADSADSAPTPEPAPEPASSTPHAELAEASGVTIPDADVPDDQLDSQRKRLRTRAINKARKALEAAQEPADGEQAENPAPEAPEPQEGASEPPEAPDEVVPESEGEKTADEIRSEVTQLLHPLYAEGGEKETAVRDLLAQFDVSRFSDVPEPKLPELLAKAKTLRGELTQSG